MKKFSIRHSTAGISIVIAIVLLFANLYAFVFRNSISEKEITSNIKMVQENLVDNTLYTITRSSTYFDPNSSFDSEGFGIYKSINFYGVRQEIENYALTAEFKENYPDYIGYRRNGMIYVRDKEEFEILERNEELSYEDININTEEPVVVNHVSSNVRDLYFSSNRSEQQITEYINKSVNPLVEFRFLNGNREVKVHNSQRGNETQKEMIDILSKSLTDKIELSTLEQKIDRLSLIVEIKPEVEKMVSDIANRAVLYDNIKGAVQSAIAVGVFFLIFGLLTNYEKSKDVKFYKFLRKIPIEIYALLVLIVFVALEGRYDYYFYFNSEDTINAIAVNKVLQVSVITIAALICISSLLFLINAFKSIYFEGFRSPYVRNSIIIRFITHFADLAKTIFNAVFSTIVSRNATSKIRWALGLLLMYLLGVIVFRYEPITWALVLLAAGFVINLFIEDFKIIEENTERIKDGIVGNQAPTRTKYFNNITDNLENIYKDLSTAIEKEVKSERLKTELITNVSHDLKTPLTAIISYSDLALNTDPSSEDMKKYVEIINERSLKLKVLIDNLFDVAKVTSNNIEINKTPISITQMIYQILGEWEDEFSKKNLEVITSTSGESRELMLDGDHTSRIFDNIFSNINKYAQENTRVYIEINQESQETIISLKNVSKYSLNISPDELMQRFTRGDESRNTEGSGLGLAIASSLTEVQGGKFNISIDGDLFKTTIIFI